MKIKWSVIYVNNCSINMQYGERYVRKKKLKNILIVNAAFFK